jgi:hypothetical protein
MSSLNPYSAILRDAGDIMKDVPYTREQLHGTGIILCVVIPCSMGAATGTIAADSLKHPTYSSRIFVGAAAGGIVAGIGCSTLHGRRMPILTLVTLAIGGALGAFGASTLKAPSYSSSSSSSSNKSA